MFEDKSTFSTASGEDLPYVVLQVTLKEKFLGTGSGNLPELEKSNQRTGGKRLQITYNYDFQRRKQRTYGRRPYSGDHGF